MSEQSKEQAPPLNIYRRINEVRKAIGYVQKGKAVEGFGYKAVTHDTVTALLRPHLITHGIIIIPSLVKAEVVDTETRTAKNIPIIRYEGTYAVSFVNADEPGNRFEVVYEAHALDQGDKAPGKALSYAVKAVMLKIFSLETGEEEESRIEQKAGEKTKADPKLEGWRKKIGDVGALSALQALWAEIPNQYRKVLESEKDDAKKRIIAAEKAAADSA